MAIVILENYIPEPNTGCWLWLRGTNSEGYPYVRIGRKTHRVSRLVWEIFRGPISPGMKVLHRCDVPLCINPDHLFLGTDHDNMKDMRDKRRHPAAKLSKNAAMEIRYRSCVGENQEILAKEFGVSRQTISNIKTGYTWRPS